MGSTLRAPCGVDHEYQRHILKGVSRTFALTIPTLPPDLCKVVGNGYLLCRIADTIEDEPALDWERKREFSEQFIDVTRGVSPPESFAARLAPLLSQHTLPAEHDLIRNTPSVIRMTRSFSPTQRIALTRCVRIMSKGMAEFQQSAGLDGLENIQHLDRYCYHVAGVVGEMLTDLFCEHVPEIRPRRD